MKICESIFFVIHDPWMEPNMKFLPILNIGNKKMVLFLNETMANVFLILVLQSIINNCVMPIDCISDKLNKIQMEQRMSKLICGKRIPVFTQVYNELCVSFTSMLFRD